MNYLNATKLKKKAYNWIVIHWKILTFGIILPLPIFTILAWQVREAEKGFSWDIFILLKIHATNQPFLDEIAKNITKLGNFEGIIGLLISIILLLIYQKKRRYIAYLIITILGNTILNIMTKIFFHRMRPYLWESSYYRPQDFSFPSGHAMGSMTLVIALLILTWGTPWRSLVGILGGLFVLVIAWTRLYLGVHFPSDILGGWILAIPWTIGMSLLFDLRQLKWNQNFKLSK
ncbi:phosphatase PAP2 family protein [Crocosphaera sp. XPORK-15E]|uniref:phosphatase PAP2 family protein n=1 Tax=Crocosphaera sp. XPORK-15E TaxID=3110247 RepID=UPI002B1EF0E2|nr:phosphatase PAP2 family protein [Crocosphaera sp. XPORK-15E]MEA5535165.1 phosphatase PAP2 family protein [Crocosphaera sp. XPORK-15E]